MDLEREKGITILAKQTGIQYGGICLLYTSDAPTICSV